MSNLPLAAIRGVRLEKIASLRELGLNPFPPKVTARIWPPPLRATMMRKEGQTATVAGRLMSWRKMGGMAFGGLQDQSGQIQIALRRGEMQGTDAANGTLGFENFNLLDVGDIVECTGRIGKTKTGEISIIADSLRILTKSLRPFPDKHLRPQRPRDHPAQALHRYDGQPGEPHALRADLADAVRDPPLPEWPRLS